MYKVELLNTIWMNQSARLQWDGGHGGAEPRTDRGARLSHGSVVTALANWVVPSRERRRLQPVDRDADELGRQRVTHGVGLIPFQAGAASEPVVDSAAVGGEGHLDPPRRTQKVDVEPDGAVAPHADDRPRLPTTSLKPTYAHRE
jgi:hypothetical protein